MSKVKETLTRILICDRAFSSMENHLCWCCCFMFESFDVKQFFSCNPAAILATGDLLVSANTLESANRNCGYRQESKTKISSLFISDEFFSVLFF